MRRYADWPTRLGAFLLSSAERRFAYGRLDCGLFVADAIRVMTGTDLAAPFRGQYRSRKEAYAVLQRYAGKASLAAAVEKAAAEHGLPEVPAACAQRGDMLLVRRASGHSLGLLDLNGRHILAPGRRGLLRLPPSRAVRAWRV